MHPCIVVEWARLNPPTNLPPLLRKRFGEDSNSEIASHWVGADWSDKILVIVSPKYDFLQTGLMLADVLSSSTRLEWKTEAGILVCRSKGTYHNKDSNTLMRARPLGDRLELPKAFPAEQFLLVQIVAFVNVLCELLERRRRTDRATKRRSYTAEIRGRLNLAKSMQRHWARGEPHKAVCEITEPSVNIPLNQAFLEAISRCAGFLAKLSEETLKPVEHKLRRARSLLHGVERLNDTSPRHLAMIRSTLRGYYAAFRPVFDLACCIIRNDSFVIQPESPTTKKSMTVPFGVNMNYLFELYTRNECEKAGVKIDDFCRDEKAEKVWHSDPTASGPQTLPPKRIPDVSGELAKNDHAPRVVVEVKYCGLVNQEDWFEQFVGKEKQLDRSDYSTPRGGFFQCCAYMLLFNASVGVLVFPTYKPSYLHNGHLGYKNGLDMKLAFLGLGKDYREEIGGLLTSILK